MRYFTISKILMVGSAIWIIVMGFLATVHINNVELFGYKIARFDLIIIGFFYIFIPFSVKPGMWARFWAIGIAVISVLNIISFISTGNDFLQYWTYVNIVPHILLTLGAILWIIQG